MTSQTRSAAIEHHIGATGTLTVKVAACDIRVLASPDDNVRVRTFDGRPLSDTVKIETGVDSLSLREAGRFLGASFLTGEHSSVGLEIEVPPSAATTVQTASGEIAANGLRGEQQYRSASGSIRLDQVAGRITTNPFRGT